MAVATKKENVFILANTDTIESQGNYIFVLTAGSGAASLTVTVGGSVILTLKALANETKSISAPIRLGNSVVATIGLTGTSPVAYAIECLED